VNLSFDDFRKTLSDEEKEVLDKILSDESRKKRIVLENNVLDDNNHLEIVNFCANFFSPGQPIAERTGYSLALLEPMYPLNVKNFDLGLFRKENSSLILVECKSSISDYRELVSDLGRSISEATNRKDELERVLGNRIADPIEFAICVPALDAPEVYNEIVRTNKPICVWAASLWERKMKIFGNKEDTKTEIESGRLHRDGNLNSVLGTGVEPKLNFLRTISILPSSHMCTLLVHVSVLIYQKTKESRISGEFQYSDVLNILMKELQTMTGLSTEDFERSATNIFNTALKKDIFKDLTEDTEELTRKIFQISGRRTNSNVVRKEVGETYVAHNAREKALMESIARYEKERGITHVTSWMSDQNNKK
jgi:hypothetical protein